MGDVTEMMLDGTLCECCGVFIEEENVSETPRLCKECAEETKNLRERMNSNVRRNKKNR